MRPRKAELLEQSNGLRSIPFFAPLDSRLCHTVHTQTPVPAPKTATLTFDPAGGTYEGKTDKFTVTATVGETIKLPAAPTRDGYTFKFWKGSEYAAGADYKVEGDHAFTAEWARNTPSKTGSTTQTPTSATTRTTASTTSSTLAKTGDTTSLVSMAALALSSGAFLLSRCTRRL